MKSTNRGDLYSIIELIDNKLISEDLENLIFYCFQGLNLYRVSSASFDSKSLLRSREQAIMNDEIINSIQQAVQNTRDSDIKLVTSSAGNIQTYYSPEGDQKFSRSMFLFPKTKSHILNPKEEIFLIYEKSNRGKFIKFPDDNFYYFPFIFLNPVWIQSLGIEIKINKARNIGRMMGENISKSSGVLLNKDLYFRNNSSLTMQDFFNSSYLMLFWDSCEFKLN
jgi:hypothetical protein